MYKLDNWSLEYITNKAAGDLSTKPSIFLLSFYGCICMSIICVSVCMCVFCALWIGTSAGSGHIFLQNLSNLKISLELHRR